MSATTTPATPGQPTNSGIVTDAVSGERHIPSSVRADGSTRKAIKIRPGYRPPEDIEVYKNRPAEAFRERAKRIGIPGAAAADDDEDGDKAASSAASNKNAKRREARKKAKAAAAGDEGNVTTIGSGAAKAAAGAEPAKEAEKEVDPEVERQKKARNLKKKLKQAKDLKNKKEGGETLLPEQIAKVIKINELIRELDALGFDAEGEPKNGGSSTANKDSEK